MQPRCPVLAVNREYQKFGRENFEEGERSLYMRQPQSLRDAFRSFWDAYENFLDAMQFAGETIRDRNEAFEAFLVDRGLLPDFTDAVLRRPEAGLLAELQPRIFREQIFQQTNQPSTHEHEAYASDYERIRGGRSPKAPIARLMTLLYVVRNNLQHGQKVISDQWPEMKERNLEVFRRAAPVQYRVVLSLFETVWTEGVFAYGTLRPGSTRFKLIRDLVKTTDEGYSVSGKLYDLGDYPGLVLGSGDRVPGQILRTDRLRELLVRIDDIEGQHFVRRLYWVTQSDEGKPALTWIYEYRGEVSGIPRCSGGVWPGR
jgi:gamma-glutamylcyclotransferase (GGCT)/AIG2-like uncharacterized protein YtfP